MYCHCIYSHRHLLELDCTVYYTQHSYRASWRAKVFVQPIPNVFALVSTLHFRHTYMSGTKAFHPQGRLPLDPFNIIGADTSLGGANAEKEQSQRKSGWTVKERNVQDIWTRHKFEQGKVILVLGEPTAKDLGPLLNSQLLSNSLLILATQRPPSELPLIIPKSTSQGPALLILRLQPLSHPIPQQTHSILSRAEIFARKWRQDRKSVFFEPEEERGRSRFGRNSKSKSDEVQLKALQLSEIGGVFGRDFDVREEIGSNSNIIPSPPPSSSSNRTKSYLRAPVFTSTSISRKNLEHRAFDAVINFVPAGFHEESHESVFMKSISSVSSASRAFLTPPVPTSSSFSGRGRSMSKGSRGRSSSLDRIRDWVRSRSRSKTRNDENSEKPIRSSGNMKTNSVGFGKHRNTNEPRKTDPSAGLSSRKGEGTVQRSEHDVLTSWSRNQLQQANCDSRVWSNSDSSLEYSRSAESKAYLIHVLPLPPPTPAPALLQTSFSRGRLSMPRSQSSSGSVLSSVDTEIPPLGARHNTSKELKNGGVSHTVPPAQKPVSVESSMAVSLNALTHSRSGSLNSTVDHLVEIGISAA
ncbi:hypothetical protein F5050DRAFT_1159187 [Lentinula boryana]|uniref:Uncharacterized protein n=1 Tax=Lentinula boryana TaxID=40481 RepID=A0ABQ8QJS1_9AGAR|nr:hypothetical protein F5050DRAFT_1159187 [Lentinula boryana]